MSEDQKWRELKIAADGDNTWQIGQMKVASYCQNKQQKENLKTRKTGAKDWKEIYFKLTEIILRLNKIYIWIPGFAGEQKE